MATLSSWLGLFCAGLLTAAPSLTAQTRELIAVDFGGNAFGISPTGQKRSLGPTGVTGCNAMAAINDTIYVSARSGTLHQLAILDPITATATVVAPNLGVDLRGLARNPTVGAGVPELLGIVNTATNADILVGIDVDTFQVTTIGPTGRSGIQALEFHGGTLYGWDVTAGLLKIDRTTGHATDPFPFLGTGGASIQYLAIDHLGRLVGGQSALYEIIPSMGAAVLRGSDGFVDLRGAVDHKGRATPFGAGCVAGAPGTTLTGGGFMMPGSSFGYASVNHQPNTSGVLLIGLSQQSLPIVGSSCLQLVTDDQSIAVASGLSGFVKNSFLLPNVFGTTLHLQLVMFENVPGGVVTTNGLTVEVPL